MESETFNLTAPPGFRGLHPDLPIRVYQRHLPQAAVGRDVLCHVSTGRFDPSRTTPCTQTLARPLGTFSPNATPRSRLGGTRSRNHSQDGKLMWTPRWPHSFVYNYLFPTRRIST